MPKSRLNNSSPLIGDYTTSLTAFEGLEAIFEEFTSASFQRLKRRQQFMRINQALLHLIEKAPAESFLLGAVIEYIARVNRAKLLPIYYFMPLFEFWLNHFSELTPEACRQVRTKIMGKDVPREAYQGIFPVGNGTIYEGTHFVAAHLSPDIDTTVASFWGWVDAFAAGVGSGQHIWCLPGGPPLTPMIQVFRDLFGTDLFEAGARQALTLTLTAYDLVTQRNCMRYTGDVSISTIDHGSNEKAILLVDEDGHYLGDWRSSDVELVRQVIVLFKSCLHWFENNFHIQLICLLANPQLTVADWPAFLHTVFGMSLGECEATQEFNEQQIADLNLFLATVLGVPQGLHTTFGELSMALKGQDVDELALFITEVEGLPYSSLFDAHGHLIEDRSILFHILEKIIIQLDIAIHNIRNYTERLDVAMEIKHQVMARAPQTYVILDSDVEEIRLKMKNYNYLTVVSSEANEKLFPVGVVWDNDLRKPILGTVSLRDFSNSEEVRMAPYLAVISTIDHHRMALQTSTTPMVLIGDVQSSNVLVAEAAFQLNDSYSTAGMTAMSIAKQLHQLPSEAGEAATVRIRQKLLYRQLLATQTPSSGFIHPQREYAEYLTFLYGILDDTDLLSKVTVRDVVCVASLLNRLKTLITGQEQEIIRLDDLVHDTTFAKQAAKRILQQEDMYSIYRKLYAHRERDVEEQIALCGEGQTSDFFSDTKVQNGSVCIGQTKLFTATWPTFQRYSSAIRQRWIDKGLALVTSHPEIDLHLHMISTITSAEDVYTGRSDHYDHHDELWLWGPPTRQAYAHLGSFLLAFQNAPEMLHNDLSLTINAQPDESQEIEEIFKRQFLPIPCLVQPLPHNPWAILHFQAGSLNSRKAMITPYLPRPMS